MSPHQIVFPVEILGDLCEQDGTERLCVRRGVAEGVESLGNSLNQLVKRGEVFSSMLGDRRVERFASAGGAEEELVRYFSFDDCIGRIRVLQWQKLDNEQAIR